MKIAGPTTSPLPGGIESLRGRTDQEALKTAAREMESLFAYQMIKAMRASSGGAMGGKGLGGDVYGSLFDIELSRVLASKGLGLQEVLLRSLARNSPQASAAAADTGMSTSLRSVGLLDVVNTTPAVPSVATPCSHTRHHRLATNPGENSGLGGGKSKDAEAKGVTGGMPVRGTRPPVRINDTAEEPAHIHDTAEAAPGIDEQEHHNDQAVTDKEDVTISGTPLKSVPSEPNPSPLTLPIKNGGRVSSGFGQRKDPFTGLPAFHRGMDIAAPEGTPIYPLKTGTVAFSGRGKGHGNLVVIDHGDGFVTKYAHNRVNRVAAGDRVGPDTIIAEVGGTGRATGPHLHFEILFKGENLRPEAMLAGIAKAGG